MIYNKLLNQKIIVILFLLGSTLALYWQVYDFEFVGYDDTLYISLSSKELTWKSVIWSFQTLDFANWHPLTWLSLILDYNLYGANAGGYHITNLLFHLANTLLLFLLFNKMTGATIRSAFVAALFALHPLHVESVAWVSERKDVLSTLFWILAMWAYMEYARKPELKKYLFIVILFFLGLMAKPMLVTLPFVFLLLDYWPLKRMTSRSTGYTDAPESAPGVKTILWLALEKVPLFMLSFLSSLITYIAQNEYKAVASFQHITFVQRILNAFNSYSHYLEKTFRFNDLGVFYPYPHDIGLADAGFSILLISSITLLVIVLVKKAPYLAVGWFWYLGTLVPVIGIIQVGAQAMADRYTYVPLIGIFICMAWGIPQVFAKIKYKKPIIAFIAAIFISITMFGAYHQVQIWKNNITLFGHVLQFSHKKYIAYHIMGFTMAKHGDNERALYYYYLALQINPEYDPAYINAGNVLQAMGRLDDAIYCFSKALQLNATSAEAEYNLGVLFLLKNRPKEAITHLSQSLTIKPGDADAYNNLGIAFMKMGDAKKAHQYIKEALRLNPDNSEARKNDAIIQEKLKR